MKFELILVLAFLGLVLASYINKKKSKKEVLHCIIGEDCNKVINSRFGKTFGVENTLLGMVYYVIVLLLSLIVLTNLIALQGLFYWIFFLVLAGSAAFSLYLTIIQLFVLKELCEYCLVSALNTILIFGVYILL